MAEEAFSICAAASDTTGNALTVAVYHVVTNPAIYANLRAELLERFPKDDEALRFTELEKLPYLTGVVKEGLRFVLPTLYFPILYARQMLTTFQALIRCHWPPPTGRAPRRC